MALYLYHKVCQHWAFVLINDNDFNDNKAGNRNDTHLFNLLTSLYCEIKHNLS